MLKCAALLGLSVFIFSPSLYAGEVDLSRQYSNCMDRSGGVTVNMLDCIAAETSRQDTRLNNAYKRTMAALNASRKKQLQEVQRLWIRYRDVNCDFYADPDGGTIAAVNSNSCYMEATAARATELENLREEY
ncbi:DUF1311 domain-containing protein [Acinetobacter sp. ANC 5380]|uniref:DUF1311 domain-containing protein n=1 Tax=Acinetobacter terrae TaxID=2731247 RepID=A0A7Y2WAP5_9GAMM|nr:lysozyme inhibitor LprI family protein [Acinetobacter terrae]NNH77646.1 DUF1311 domain-containing protein [Acinetobacter terrae]